MLPKLFRQNSFDNFFEDFAFGNPFGLKRAPERSKDDWVGLMRTDVKEKDGRYSAEIDLPGCKKEDISIELNSGYLTVSAVKNYSNDEKDDGGNYVRRERFSGQCQRTFFIGENVKQEDVHAKFDNGILSLDFPKEPQETKSNLIQIEG